MILVFIAFIFACKKFSVCRFCAKCPQQAKLGQVNARSQEVTPFLSGWCHGPHCLSHHQLPSKERFSRKPQ